METVIKSAQDPIAEARQASIDRETQARRFAEAYTQQKRDAFEITLRALGFAPKRVVGITYIASGIYYTLAPDWRSVGAAVKHGNVLIWTREPIRTQEQLGAFLEIAAAVRGESVTDRPDDAHAIDQVSATLMCH